MKKLCAVLFMGFVFANCTSSPKHIESIPLKYPVILVHGIVAHDRWDFFSFWGRIPSILEERGVRVFFGNTDSWGTYESNAAILKETIDAVLQSTNSEKVNIIAHSKGGLDSRYFLWKYDYGDKVASLTTMSTPHRGAEIADVVWEQRIVHTEFGMKILKLFGEMYGDQNPDLYNVGYALSTDNMEKFNEEVVLDHRVYFQSIYSVIRRSTDDLMFYNSHRYIKRITGENDGVVSEHSAAWGENIIKIETPLNHIEIIDIKMRKISGLDVPDIYIGILNNLAEKGF
ncbi:MAG: hypothetical protein FWC01_03870 [Treponema sp.]|nr:hypothetical protein [Treponema sp.]MCL2238309.1 hypothetical protein [Treponema sp.]